MILFSHSSKHHILCGGFWGNIQNQHKPSFMLQKKAIRTVNRSDYYEPTNVLFINLHTLKFGDLVYLKAAQIMYEAQDNLLPNRLNEGG